MAMTSKERQEAEAEGEKQQFPKSLFILKTSLLFFSGVVPFRAIISPPPHFLNALLHGPKAPSIFFFSSVINLLDTELQLEWFSLGFGVRL